MKATSKNLNITYPDLGFAFNPIRVLVEGISNTDYIAIKANNFIIEREVSPTTRSVSFDLSAVVKSLFDRLDFHKVEEQDTTLFKTIDFKIYNPKNGESIYENSIPILWGALQIGERYAQNKTLTYFPGYPFTIPLYLEEKVFLQASIDKGDLQDIGSYDKGKFNINLPLTRAKKSVFITSATSKRYKIFDYTFDFTFGPQRVDFKTELNINIDISNCVHEGVYLRWINKHGEYNYYLFQSSNKTATVKNSDIKLNNGYYTTDLTNGYHQGIEKHIGKNIEQSMKLFAHLVDSETFDFLLDLVESPVVDMFLGYTEKKSEKWVSVDVKEGTFAKSMSALQDFEFFLIPNNKQVQTL